LQANRIWRSKLDVAYWRSHLIAYHVLRIMRVIFIGYFALQMAIVIFTALESGDMQIFFMPWGVAWGDAWGYNSEKFENFEKLPEA
ncbi:hypothetical protein T4B_11988, partial [Trichinella pseudospiralis]